MNPEDERSERSTIRSKALHESASELFPGGVSHNVRYVEPYPIYFDSTDGATFTDVDGNEYLDFWMNHHTSILGHGHPAVVEAVTEQATDDVHYGAPSKKAIELARLVQNFVPSMEQMRFCASGTEATMYAVRLARARTGRSRVLKATGGWHGGNTDLAVDVYPPFDAPTTVGLPPGAAEHVHSFSKYDPQNVEELLDKYEDEVAAVIIDPRKGGTPPDTEFLQYLKAESNRRGFLLIFDEVVTGFRVSPGSYQARVDVLPDLTALGKCLGGGLPVGALVGRAELFEPSRPDIEVDLSERVIAGGGTFSVNPMTLSAGIATLSTIEQEQIHDHTETMAQQLRDGLSDIFEDSGVDAEILGLSSLVLPAFNPERPLESPQDVKEATDKQTLIEFHNRLLDAGFYFLPGHMGNVCYPITAADIEDVIDAAAETVAGMQADGAL